jgi:hypothetical protein
MKLEFVHVPEGRTVAVELPFVQVRYGEMVSTDGAPVAEQDAEGYWIYDGQTYTDFIAS